MGLVDATGKAVASDDKFTGRELHIKEKIVNGRSTWGLVPVGGEFEGDEIVQILSITIHGMATRARAEFAHFRAMKQAQQSVDSLKKEK